MELKTYNKSVAHLNSVEDVAGYIKKNIYVDMRDIPIHLEPDVQNILTIPSINKTEFHKRIRSIFSEKGEVLSRYQIRYWINRGYDEVETTNIINSLQKKNSPRHTEYWTNRGYSHIDAVKHVSEYQTKIGDVNKTISPTLLAKRSQRCIEYWIDKGYSESDAELKISELQRKTTLSYWESVTDTQRDRHRMIGEKNGMYGKPSPVKSGHGYSGWYKGSFFRSLHELNYMVNVIERFNIPYKSAESSGIRIVYTGINGQKRTYVGDFIIADKYYVEVKPKRLSNTIENTIKREAAIDFCNKIGLKYKMTDCGTIPYNQLITLVENGSVVFTKNYELRIKQYLYKINRTIQLGKYEA
jgi:hypothetical protein